MAKRARPKPKKARHAAKTSARRGKRPVVKAAKRKAAKRSGKRRTVRAKSKAAAGIERLPTPPSSLNLDRQASAARTGRRLVDENLRRHPKMSALTAGDVDADMESAYFSGEETPGGDNPTPDQSGVDDIGHAVGVEYQGNEELKSTEKIDERDRHRWENE
jgi:hypothetical protein